MRINILFLSIILSFSITANESNQEKPKSFASGDFSCKESLSIANVTTQLENYCDKTKTFSITTTYSDGPVAYYAVCCILK
jgi:hypothetical protein